MSFGLSGVIPAIHYGLMEGWFSKISQASLGWLVLMGKVYYFIPKILPVAQF